jgi:MFS family permease
MAQGGEGREDHRRELTEPPRRQFALRERARSAILALPSLSNSGGTAMNLVDRVKNILLQPKAEWAVIEPEQTDPKTLYTTYIVILALIPAVAGLISTALVVSMLGGSIGLGFAVGAALMQYLLSLVMVFAVAFIADALAPSFEGQKNLNQALKLTAYAMTASWVAGVFIIIPVLGWLLALLGGLYALYLFYLGAPVLMKVPEAKVVGYTVVVVVVAIVVGLVIGMINAAIIGMGAVGMVGGMR